MQVKSVKFNLSGKDEDEVRIISFFYKSLDFSLFTLVDTIEISDRHFNYNDIIKN